VNNSPGYINVLHTDVSPITIHFKAILV